MMRCAEMGTYLISGLSIRRASWPERVRLRQLMGNTSIVVICDDSDFWLVYGGSVEDFLATDWEVFEDSDKEHA